LKTEWGNQFKSNEIQTQKQMIQNKINQLTSEIEKCEDFWSKNLVNLENKRKNHI
jgi:hypothetical protein